MGFDKNGVKLLIKARKLGVDFEKVITIGRQGLYLNKKGMKNLVLKAGLSNFDSNEIFNNNRYAEPFLKLLGANTIDSIDASEYEKATVIRDLNLPISNELKSKYTLVIDGGSLEHIFNFPVAIKNCMDLIQKDGYYIGISPANNFFGHGFYQFSPELYFRIFNPSNGFRLVKMYFYIDRKRSSIFEVSDPLEVKQRVTMVNSYPTYLFIIAQKIEEIEAFNLTPQQSDYELISWKGKTMQNTTERESIINLIGRLTPKFIKIGILRIYRSREILKLYRQSGISNSRLIKKVRISIKK